MAESQDERAEAHNELARERWRTHREKHDDEKEARAIAVGEINRRLDELNKLRDEVTTDRAQFVTAPAHKGELDAVKAEFRGKLDGLNLRIDGIEKLLDRAEGSATTWRYIFSFLGVGGVGAVIWALLQSGAPR